MYKKINKLLFAVLFCFFINISYSYSMINNAIKANISAAIIQQFTPKISSNIITMHAFIVGIIDGDTITIIDENKTLYKVRLTGIDAPEKRQAFGMASKKNLSDLIYYKNVIIEYKKFDKYHRILGKIISDDIDINLQQIKDGMAWHYKKYQNEQSKEDRIVYSQAENMAKYLKIGIWKDNNPIEPWRFRKINRKIK